MNSRLSEINTWVSGLVPDLQAITPIQSDASARQYYRVRAKTASYIVMDTQPGIELLNFIQIGELLSTEIAVPAIIGRDLDRGLLLLSDLGNTTYLQILQNGDADQINQLYIDAINTMCDMQTITASLPKMDHVYIADRLEVLKTWYLQRHLNIDCPDQLMGQLLALFTENFQQQPQVLVHLDYHSRNLMVLPQHNPGVLDYQDAMHGPHTYDLVSLLQDAYITWPRSQVEDWIGYFATRANLNFDAQLVRDFDLVGLQRHLKNLGVFARLHYRDGKSHYLPHIPTLLSYINETCARYAELAPLHEFMQKHVIPVNA